MLRTQQTQGTQGTLVVPTNVGQEILDVVGVTDERCGISGEKLSGPGHLDPIRPPPSAL